MKTQINKLVEKKMKSNTEVEQNNFKTAVEQFINQMKTVMQDIGDSNSSHKLKAAKNPASTR